MGTGTTRDLIARGLSRFAQELRARWGAERVLLFGSRARAHHRQDSDYDFITVSPQFEGVHRRERARGLREVFYESAGRAPIDLICLTPEEFDQARTRISLVAAVLPEAIDLLASTQPAA